MSAIISKSMIRDELRNMLPKEVSVTGIVLEKDSAGFILHVPEHNASYEALRKNTENHIKAYTSFTDVHAVLTNEHEERKPVPPATPTPQPLAGIKHVIAVGSGKGGVGKSTVAVNIATALAQQNLSVGLVDADIHGPSVAYMMGVSGEPEVKNKQMLPPIAHGVKVMSMGLLLGENVPVVWRGPMVTKALHQLMRGADWGELDYLIIDLPPGTGDIHLSIAQNFEVDGVLMVTTPQSVAALDVKKAFEMLAKVSIPVIGLVENMSYIEDDNGKRYHPFGSSKTASLAKDYHTDIWAEIPLREAISEESDKGQPAIIEDKETRVLFHSLVDKIVAKSCA